MGRRISYCPTRNTLTAILPTCWTGRICIAGGFVVWIRHMLSTSPLLSGRAVQRFARERTREERAERGELGRLGTIVCLVLLVPVFVLHALFLPIGWVID